MDKRKNPTKYGGQRARHRTSATRDLKVGFYIIQLPALIQKVLVVKKPPKNLSFAQNSA